MKHTKGEWRHQPNSNWVGIGSSCIATTQRQNFKLKSTGEYEPCEEMIDNAKLIAAAPELLEACLIAYVKASAEVKKILSQAIDKATA